MHLVSTHPEWVAGHSSCIFVYLYPEMPTPHSINRYLYIYSHFPCHDGQILCVICLLLLVSYCTVCLYSCGSVLFGRINRGVHSRHQSHYKIYDNGEYGVHSEVELRPVVKSCQARGSESLTLIATLRLEYTTDCCIHLYLQNVQNAHSCLQQVLCSSDFQSSVVVNSNH